MPPFSPISNHSSSEDSSASSPASSSSSTSLCFLEKVDAISYPDMSQAMANMSVGVSVNMTDGAVENDLDSHDHESPFKPLVLDLSSSPSTATLGTASTASTSSNSLSSTLSDASSFTISPSEPQAGIATTAVPAPAAAAASKMQRKVSFHEDIDVFAVERLQHPQDIQDRWYSKRELHIIRHKIRSLLRWYNMRNAHFFQYEQQPEAEYCDDDSQERYLRNAPPPPQPPCVTFYDECLFGLEKHLSAEKEQVRETKWHAQQAVLGEQYLQKAQGEYDHDRMARSYAESSAASQLEAIAIAQINAEESELHRQELEEQQRLEEEQRSRLHYLQQQKESEQRRIEALETTLYNQDESDLEHLYLGEGKPPKNPLNIFKNWGACFGKLFRSHECEIDADDDCLNPSNSNTSKSNTSSSSSDNNSCFSPRPTTSNDDFYYR